MASSRNLVSTIGAQASPTMGDRTRCPEWQAFPAGMPHPLQMLHGNHSYSVKVNLGIKVMTLVESLIGWGVIVVQRSECHLTFVRGILHIAE